MCEVSEMNIILILEIFAIDRSKSLTCIAFNSSVIRHLLQEILKSTGYNTFII